VKRFEDLEDWQRECCEQFKTEYPNHGAPDKTDREFARMNPDRQTCEQIVKAVQDQKNSYYPTRLNKNDPQFIPQAWTWLRDGDWKLDGKIYEQHHPGESPPGSFSEEHNRGEF